MSAPTSIQQVEFVAAMFELDTAAPLLLVKQAMRWCPTGWQVCWAPGHSRGNLWC